MIMTEVFILLNLFSGIKVDWIWSLIFIFCDGTCWLGLRNLIEISRKAVNIVCNNPKNIDWTNKPIECQKAGEKGK